MEGLTKEEVKKYIRYIADRRLISMGMRGIFKVKRNPLPWVEEMINAPTHTNFFENRVTDYVVGHLVVIGVTYGVLYAWLFLLSARVVSQHINLNTTCQNTLSTKILHFLWRRTDRVL